MHSPFYFFAGFAASGGCTCDARESARVGSWSQQVLAFGM